jgi:hypothetical protein
MASDIFSYGRRPQLPSDLGGQLPPNRPPCDNQPPPPPRCHHPLAHALVLTIKRRTASPWGYGDPWPHRPCHYWSTTDRPSPLALATHGHRPGTPGHPPAVAPPGSLPLVPLFRPLEANPVMGLLPPGYQYVPSGNFFHFSVRGKSEGPRVTAPRPNFSRNKIRLANPAFRDFSAAPLLTPWPSPNRRFLVPMMAVSPLNRTLI